MVLLEIQFIFSACSISVADYATGKIFVWDSIKAELSYPHYSQSIMGLDMFSQTIT